MAALKPEWWTYMAPVASDLNVQMQEMDHTGWNNYRDVDKRTKS